VQEFVDARGSIATCEAEEGVEEDDGGAEGAAVGGGEKSKEGEGWRFVRRLL
jgi:hypothetical protein